MLRIGSARSTVPPEGLTAAAFFAALLIFAWALLFRMDGARDLVICRADDTSLLALSSMWAVMMVAMMAPSALPVILTYAHRVSRREPEEARLGLVAVFIAPYFLIWVLFAVLAAFAQSGLSGAGVLQDGKLSAPLLAGGLLLVAGAYQWSAVKAACLARCHARSALPLQSDRHGVLGAARLGFEHGVACVGCCWLLMLLAFVGGSMNLIWMIVLTLFVAVEKFIGAREGVLRLSAVVLIVVGTAHVAGVLFALP